MQSTDILKLTELKDLPVSAIHQMLEESTSTGYQLVQRTIDDWESGTNTFSKPGEKLWGLFLGPSLVGICGLNRDPYTTEPNTGRVRHLYVMEANRRKGYAALLIDEVMREAKQHFTTLRLFTENPAAAKFYEGLGFKNVDDDKVSHIIVF